MKGRLRLLVLATIVSLAFTSIASAAGPPPGKGKPGGGEEWKYTALGDSLANGLWAFRGYVPRYQDYIESDNTNVSVKLTNFAENGMTSGELLEALRSDRKLGRNVRKSQVLTWDIGGADFMEARDSYKAGTCGGGDNQNCLSTAVETFKDNWNDIIVEILSLRDIDKTIIRTMNLPNPYVNEDKAEDTWKADDGLNDFQVFKPYVDAVNEHICSSAASNGIKCADVYLEFNGPKGDEDPEDKGYISFDGVHPNGTGHKVIADLLRGLGYAPLR